MQCMFLLKGTVSKAREIKSRQQHKVPDLCQPGFHPQKSRSEQTPKKPIKIKNPIKPAKLRPPIRIRTPIIPIPLSNSEVTEIHTTQTVPVVLVPTLASCNSSANNTMPQPQLVLVKSILPSSPRVFIESLSATESMPTLPQEEPIPPIHNSPIKVVQSPMSVILHNLFGNQSPAR